MILEPRLVKLTTRTGIEIRRTLPNARKRMIGAWAFVDHFGPTQQTDGMVVAAHPHTGLQTATWLFEGRIEHRDSIGTIQHIEPGQLNLMTAGHGISHSELSEAGPQSLHAVQLWIALPDSVREVSPAFEHISELPEVVLGRSTIKVFAGELLGVTAPTKLYSKLVGAELRIPAGTSLTLPVDSSFEHGVMPVQGDVTVNGTEVTQKLTEYLSPGAERIEITAGKDDVIAVLLGGEPFSEPIVMWWNFIARTHDEIVEQREQWNARDPRFGEFQDRIGGWIPAPDLPNVTLRSRN